MNLKFVQMGFEQKFDLNPLERNTGTEHRMIGRLIHECRCDERLKPRGESSTHLVYTGLRGGMEHLRIETRLIDERFESVVGE